MTNPNTAPVHKMHMALLQRTPGCFLPLLPIYHLYWLGSDLLDKKAGSLKIQQFTRAAKTKKQIQISGNNI